MKCLQLTKLSTLLNNTPMTSFNIGDNVQILAALNERLSKSLDDEHLVKISGGFIKQIHYPKRGEKFLKHTILWDNACIVEVENNGHKEYLNPEWLTKTN